MQNYIKNRLKSTLKMWLIIWSAGLINEWMNE
jgi:hypothetical protein